MKILSKVYIVLLSLGTLVITLPVFGQIGTNPVNATNNNAFGSNVPPKFKGDSGTVKKLYTSKSVRYISLKDLNKDSLVFTPLDTGVVGTERYSPLFPYDNYHLSLGGLGLPQRQLIPDFGSSTGFHNGQNSLSLYILEPENLNYYRNKSPYTELAFLGGGKKEQWFSLIHTQNINPRLNIGLKYFRVGSQGFYYRQKTDDLNLAFFAWYQSRNYRYNLITSLVFNSLNAQENGGVNNDSLFSSTAPTTIMHDQQTVYLYNAQTSWNQFDFSLGQIYNIGHLDSVKDRSFRTMKVYPLVQAKYTLHFKLNKYNFDDVLNNQNQTASYYPNDFLDTAFTHDKIIQRTVENEFGLSLFGHGNLKKEGHFSASGIHLDASIKDQLIHFQQNGKIDTSLNNIIIHSKASYNLSDRFRLEFNGDYDLIGANHLDYNLEANAFLSLGKVLGGFRGYVSTEAHQPDYNFDHNYSNAYRWNYTFGKVKTEKLGGSYENNPLGLKVSAEINLVDGYTYFAGVANQLVFPNQFLNQIRIIRLRLDKIFTYKNLGLQLYGIYQKNNQPLIVRSPDWYGFASLYYQKTLYGVLRTRIGVDMTYFSKTYYYDYAPGLQNFFVYTNAQFGNYPVANFFIVAGLKRVKLTIKYDYINQGLPQLGYYVIHNYPAPDRVLKFGVSWKFYD